MVRKKNKVLRSFALASWPCQHHINNNNIITITVPPLPPLAWWLSSTGKHWHLRKSGCQHCGDIYSTKIPAKFAVTALGHLNLLEGYNIYSSMSLWVDKHRPTALGKLDYHKDQAIQLKKLVRKVKPERPKWVKMADVVVYILVQGCDN